MSQWQYDIVTVGGEEPRVAISVASGSSISTSAVRITLDDSNCTSKRDALLAISAIYDKITRGQWPPNTSTD